MSHQSSEPLPANGRLICAGMAAAAAIGLLINHFTIETQNVARLMLLCLGPLALFLGLGGMIEPKIFWSVGKYGRHLPVIYKVIGGALGAAGVAVTILLLLFVYRFGPPEPKPRARRPNLAATNWKLKSSQPVPASKPEPRMAPQGVAQQGVAPQEVMPLTYDRPSKRWVQMDAEALQGVRREQAEGLTTLEYAEGEHALLKVLWPEVLEVGDRFTVELQGANSIEMVDLDGADANARTSLPASDAFVVVEIHREQDKITFRCDGQAQQAYYASGKLRGDEAKAALLAAELRPGFSLKKGAQASYRNAQIVKP